MSFWICCNFCFHPPGSDRKLAVTTCGHLICSVCFQKGTQGTCLICSAKCQVSPLSDKSSSEVKALFSDINSVASKHFTEISKVIMFQARHQKRLLAYYQQKNEKLEQTLVKMKQEMQQMMKKQNEQSAYIKKLENSFQHQSTKASVAQKNHSSRTPQGNQPVMHIPFSSPLSFSVHSSTAILTKNMDVDETSLFRKPSNSTSRLSLTSPSQEGRMGTIPHKIFNQNRLANHSASSASVSHFQTAPITPEISFSSGLKSPIFKPPTSFRHPSMSSLVNLPP
ncbi:probable E3 SUMO-protein ligase RNF212 [Boleophthalmus pectinirostris]|uniref:probable E3 SUMO-protein ligase RNF212 n=1 Tax=Boleophthalmus pectinirostris TaxID=150288 RepID=UPI0024314C3D|nr:probable E3 SUMO-protein ligase RNF212 [Boleophthalmus pectinirostris]